MRNNLGYIASLHAFLITLLEQAREWNRRVDQIESRERDDGADKFYDIFMFGPHG
jgi:hypothetical protein